MDIEKHKHTPLFWILTIISGIGILLVANAISHLLIQPTPAVMYFHLIEISVIGLVLSPWSVKLPSGAFWRPSMPLLMLSIFAVPPSLTTLIPIPSLITITWLARGKWWKYIETISHVGIGLYLSTLLYHFILGLSSHSITVRLTALAVALITHLAINRFISSMIVAYRRQTSLLEQIKQIGRELHWGYANSYLIVFLAVMNQVNLSISILVCSALQVGILLAVSHYSKVEQLQKSVWIDGVTNCENRNAWEEWVKTSSNLTLSGTLFVVDIDNFKMINDTHGHLVGDTVLRELTNALKNRFQRGVRLFRYGGDEFAGYAASATEADVRTEVNMAVDALNAESKLDNFQVSVSIGTACAPTDSTSLTELFQLADTKMYEEKRRGKLLLTGIEIGVPTSILGLVVALESRDIYTAGHITRVAYYALKLADYMGVPSTEKKSLFRSALVHDIGKIGVPDAILNKTESLNEAETRLIRLHPEVGYEMCSKLGFNQHELDVVRYHHEHWNGTGYPEKLEGIDIPLLARIVTLADVYDALTSNRSYRAAWSHEEAMVYIRDNKGILFDPECVDQWVSLNSLIPVSSQFPDWVRTGALSNLVSTMSAV